MKKLVSTCLFLSMAAAMCAQHSVARQWNEALLDAIRNDFARPTVHARNLFHTSAAMYDVWAIFSPGDSTYLLGNTVHDFTSPFDGFPQDALVVEDARAKAISYAMYRLINHRFKQSPGYPDVQVIIDSLFIQELGYDTAFTSTDYATGSPAALGNYIAGQYIAYGLQDGANEQNGYENQFYTPVNEFLNTESPGNPNITDPNRWQPLAFDVFIDQSGNVFPNRVPEFVGAEWGWVEPFSLTDDERVLKERDGIQFPLYHDPGPPPYLDPVGGSGMSDEYKWNFALVAVWSGHLDANLDQEVDISPASLGNFDINDLPQDFSDYDQFYDLINGGGASTGYPANPVTGEDYAPQIVQLGDYARILAEFWADGPDSETPPGHWFTLLNYVHDHPLTEKRWAGQGPLIDDLEWDIKSYFTLGGAMHDVAVSVWGLKGYYDYIRPVSAIRYMADRGQSSDTTLPNYHVAGIPLIDGHIELVMEEDPLVGFNQRNLHKIKIRAWKGPDYIDDPETDVAGVGWILAENWWPYQRPSFITPPFAGYVSGHSTFSRAAAEILTRITGSPYFPGGMGVFDADQNEFLVFEEGPSTDIELQWASYQDASDQCSLSRIWGGIHPPADDLNGRRIGEIIGNEAFDFALTYFAEETVSRNESPATNHDFQIYPNPVNDLLTINSPTAAGFDVELRSTDGRLLSRQSTNGKSMEVNTNNLPTGTYVLLIRSEEVAFTQLVVK
jgi:hypothetical protein